MPCKFSTITACKSRQLHFKSARRLLFTPRDNREFTAFLTTFSYEAWVAEEFALYHDKGYSVEEFAKVEIVPPFMRDNWNDRVEEFVRRGGKRREISDVMVLDLTEESSEVTLRDCPACIGRLLEGFVDWIARGFGRWRKLRCWWLGNIE